MDRRSLQITDTRIANIVSAQLSQLHAAQSAIVTRVETLEAVGPDVTEAFQFVLGDGVSVPTTGLKGYWRAPFACTIVGWEIVADAVGSIVVDLWKDTYANFPPTVADTVTGTEKPTIAAAQKAQDLSLTTWTTSWADGDWIGINIDSVATIKQVTLALLYTR